MGFNPEFDKNKKPDDGDNHESDESAKGAAVDRFIERVLREADLGATPPDEFGVNVYNPKLDKALDRILDQPLRPGQGGTQLPSPDQLGTMDWEGPNYGQAA